MSSRARHEWYIKQALDNARCRNCGIEISQEMYAADLILRCDWPNKYADGNVTLFIDSLTELIEQVKDSKSPLAKMLRKIQ